MTRKITYGIKKVHFAPYELVNGVPVYDTPIPWPGATALTLEPRGEVLEFYADDQLYYEEENNQGYEGTITSAGIPEEFSIACLGEVKNADGVIAETSNPTKKKFALLFEFKDDKSSVRRVLYSCSARRPTISSSTKTDSAEVNTPELVFVASPRETDGIVKHKTSPDVDTTVYNNWYNSVYEFNADTTPPTVTVSPEDTDTGVLVTANIVWTFNKAIRETDVNDGNFYLMKADGTPVPGALSLDATKKVVTFDPTANLAASTDYIAVASKNIRDMAGNKLAANSVVNFTTA